MMKIACLVSITVLVQLASSAPNPLDEINIHLHLDEMIKKATGGADYSDAISVDAGNDYIKKDIEAANKADGEANKSGKVAPKAAGEGSDYWESGWIRDVCHGVKCTGKRTAVSAHCCKFGK